MHANGGDGIDAVGVGYAVDYLGDVVVLVTRLDGGGGYEHGVVGGHGYVAGFIVNCGRGVGRVGYDESVGCYGDVAVNVTAKIEFDNVSSFEWFLCMAFCIVC